MSQKMQRSLLYFFFCLLSPVFCLLSSLAAAPRDEGEYRYVDRNDLGIWLRFQSDHYLAPNPASGEREKLRDLLNKPVLTVDELAVVWSHQDVSGYFKFDTYQLRCVVSVDDSDSLAVLQEVRRSEVQQGRVVPRLLELRGSFQKLKVHGKIDPAAERLGVATEQVYFVVDRVTKPSPLRVLDFQGTQE